MLLINWKIILNVTYFIYYSKESKKVIKIRVSKNRHYNDQDKEVQKDKQRSTEYTNKTKDRVTRAPLKIEYELRCYGRVSSSRSTSGKLQTR